MTTKKRAEPGTTTIVHETYWNGREWLKRKKVIKAKEQQKKKGETRL